MRTVCFLFFAVIPALVFARDATFRFIGGDNVGIPGDSYYSQTLALRFRHLARTALPRITAGLSAEIPCSYLVPPPDGKGTFGLVRKGWGRREITLPERFESWADDPVKLRYLLTLFIQFYCSVSDSRRRRRRSCRIRGFLRRWRERRSRRTGDCGVRDSEGSPPRMRWRRTGCFRR